MYIEDLLTLPADHPPSPYPVPLPLKRGELWGTGRLPEESTLLPVGWLGDSVPSSGSTDAKVIDRLLTAYREKALFSDGFDGFHDCELCPGPEAWYPGGKVGPVVRWRDQEQRLFGHGHYLIRLDERVFMAPALLLHYILDHGYRPPDDFSQAVLSGAFLSPDDLIWERPPRKET